MLCLYCGNPLPIGRWKYCSIKCRHKWDYIKNKQKYIDNAVNWQKNNPEKYKKIQKKAMYKYVHSDKFRNAIYKNYKNNPQKWRARHNSYYHHIIILKEHNNQCDICKSIDNLEIHHLDYTWDKEGKNNNNLKLNLNKLMVLCKSCHSNQSKKQ